MSALHKHSRKREAIRRLLSGTKEHPSAEWIYARLKPDYPDLSLGTVYRNLGLFLSEGEIMRVGTVAGQDRFITDVDAPKLDEERYGAEALRIEGEIRGHSLTFFGLCGKCCEQRDLVP